MISRIPQILVQLVNLFANPILAFNLAKSIVKGVSQGISNIFSGQTSTIDARLRNA